MGRSLLHLSHRRTTGTEVNFAPCRGTRLRGKQGTEAESPGNRPARRFCTPSPARRYGVPDGSLALRSTTPEESRSMPVRSRHVPHNPLGR